MTKRRNTQPHHAPAVYVSVGDAFDILTLYEVMVIPEDKCPSRMWFRQRAWTNRFLIAQHSVNGTRLVLRLK